MLANDTPLHLDGDILEANEPEPYQQLARANIATAPARPPSPNSQTGHRAEEHREDLAAAAVVDHGFERDVRQRDAAQAPPFLTNA